MSPEAKERRLLARQYAAVCAANLRQQAVEISSVTQLQRFVRKFVTSGKLCAAPRSVHCCSLRAKYSNTWTRYALQVLLCQFCHAAASFSEAFDKSLQNSNLRTSPSDSEVLACSTDMMICFVHASVVIMHNNDNNNLQAFQLIVLAYLGTY